MQLGDGVVLAASALLQRACHIQEAGLVLLGLARLEQEADKMLTHPAVSPVPAELYEVGVPGECLVGGENSDAQGEAPLALRPPAPAWAGVVLEERGIHVLGQRSGLPVDATAPPSPHGFERGV